MAARNIGRREALGLGAVGAAAVAVGLTGCAPATSSNGSSGSSSSSGSSNSSAGAGTTVAALADVPVGTIVSTKLSGKPVVVTHASADAVACFSAVCPHEGCTVAGKGNQIVCPCHGAVFDPATGAAISGPTKKALTGVAVKVNGTNIVTS